jgi:hypothetical protein
MGLNAQAQVQTAGELFVDVDATAAPLGSLVSITNNGTLGGYFLARGALQNIPNVAFSGGTLSMRFDGSDYLQLVTNDVNGVAGPIPAPAGLLGLDPTRTIEVWALNPAIAGEETMVSWARRGGGNGSNVSFNYGQDAAFGAMGHWGPPDIGWNNTAGNAPQRNRWHHLVYTYDGTTTRVYTNGVLANMEVLGTGAVNTQPGVGINLAAQFDNATGTVTAGLRGSLGLGRVRIHDGVLSDAQILSNYIVEKPAFTDPDSSLALLSGPPVHRYSFNEVATNDAGGLVFVDSIGTAHGVVQGVGAQFTGSKLLLPGGSSTTNAYGDLPNGLLSVNSTNNGGTGGVTLEAWFRSTAARQWARVFDIGSRAGTNEFGAVVGTEVPGPGTGGLTNLAANGLDYFFYSAQLNNTITSRRMELRNDDPSVNPVINADAVPVPANATAHIVVTWNESTGRIQVYEDSVEVISTLTTNAISSIKDLNVWLGRSQFAADQNLQGELEEFRIYNRVLTQREVNGNFQAGPDTVNDTATPAGISTQPQNVTALNTYAATFSVGAVGTPPIYFQWLRDGVAIPGATSSRYSFNVTLADSGATFSVIVSNFVNETPASVASSSATLTVVTQAVTLKHRYTFNQIVGDTNVIDVISENNGQVRGGGAFTGDGKLQLNGTDSYVNLPNNLVTGFTSITIEAWVQDEGSAGWARLFDFGNSAGGEDFPIGSAGAGGSQYMFLAFPAGTGNLRGAYTIAGGGAAEQLIEWVGNRPPANVFHHIAWTSSDPADTGRLFVNGVQVGENRNVTLTPAGLGPTVNNWLGRAQFNDPLFRGKFDEFCIWDGAMTPSQVQARFAAGPDTRPAGVHLSITRGVNTVTLRWPASAADYFLEASPRIGSDAAWDLVFDVPTLEGDSFVLTVSTDEPVPQLPGRKVQSRPQFYRLSR